MTKAASEGELAGLHVLVAQVLKERIANPELCTAADINAAIKFLKDNTITCSVDKDNHLGELEEQLAETKALSTGVGASDADLQAALDAIPFMGAPN